MVVAALVVFVAIKEPKTYKEESDEERWWDTLRQVGAIPREERKSLLLLLLAIFSWFVGYNAIETFFTSYGTFRLGVAESTASLLLGFFSLTFILFSIPGGMLAERWGRRRTILTGLVALTLLLLAGLLPAQRLCHRRYPLPGRHRLGLDQHQFPAHGRRHRSRRSPAGHLHRPVLHRGHAWPPSSVPSSTAGSSRPPVRTIIRSFMSPLPLCSWPSSACCS